MIDESEFLKFCKKSNNGGFVEIKEYIDSKGKFKTIKGSSGITALHVAARANNLKIVQLLLDNGMSPMLRDETKSGKTPIVDALENGNIDVALAMITYPSIKPLKTAKRYNEFSALSSPEFLISDYRKVLKALVNAGFDVDALDDTSANSLTKAIQLGNLDRVKVCVEVGMNINNPTRPPLKFALYRDPINLDIVEYLLEKGSKLNIEGFNALETAHYRDNHELFWILLSQYNGKKFLMDSTVDEIMTQEDIPFLKLLWDIPKVQKFILDNDIHGALPGEIQDVFIF